MAERLDYARRWEELKEQGIVDKLIRAKRLGMPLRQISRITGVSHTALQCWYETKPELVAKNPEIIQERLEKGLKELEEKEEIRKNYVKSIKQLSVDRDAKNFKLVADYLEIGGKAEEEEPDTEVVEDDNNIHIIVENTADEGGFDEEVKGILEETNED